MIKRKLTDLIVSPDSTIHSVVDAIQQSGVRGVFVCDSDRELVGIVMDSDIRRSILKNMDLKASVKTIMKTSPFIIYEDVPTEKRKELFVEKDKMLVPIVSKNNRVVDYMWIHDILDKETYHKVLEVKDIDGGIIPPQKILVVGGVGYIGSILTEKLLRMGYKVRVLDILLYGKDSLHFLEREGFEFVRGDCRDLETIKQALNGVDAVIHLGEIVGDPACSVNETFTIDTNYSATHMIVEQCIRLRIKRFIFASSCSVYGQSDCEVTEESPLNPCSLYARCKIESEKAILASHYNRFCPIILRLATVHGRSHRQRFDLVVNKLTLDALTKGRIHIFGGKQWRPFISVYDICQCIVLVLHADNSKIINQIFNVGDARENYRLLEVGNIIQELIPTIEVVVEGQKKGLRSYRVNFERIKEQLAFSSEYKVIDSIKDFINAYQTLNMYKDYNDSKYYNVRALKEV
jgi:nucleoside-diphosphate-sugar epimerase